jgi:hypothetical protein
MVQAREDSTMRTRGIKVIDPTVEAELLEWLIVPARECPDETSEQRIIASHFRVPHSSWGTLRAFVRPVQIRRSRRRVLFCQRSGIDL